ncbi:MAG: carbohydrate-binding family 9-like protein [Armatimonadota bacterium]|jgi:hypothetical protein
MTRTMALTLLITLTAAAVALAGPSGAERVYIAPPVAGAATRTPDGLADLPAMQPFLAPSGTEAAVQTRAWALQGAEALEIVVECMEPRMDTLVAEHQPADGDVRVFTDDCVEVFIAPTGSQDDYFHLAANALGATFDERVKDTSWDGEWTVEAHRQDDRWWLRITVPWATVDAAPVAGAMWSLNISRQRHAGGELQLSSWSDAGTNFHHVARWGRLLPVGDTAAVLDRHVRQPWAERVGDLITRAEIDAQIVRRLHAALSPLQESLAPVFASLEAGGPDSADELSALLVIGEAGLGRLEDLEEGLGEAIRGREVARQIRRMAGGRVLVAWPVTAITNRRIMPVPEPPERLGGAIRMRACRGEFAPASFVVYSIDEEMTVLPVLSDLDGPGLGLRARHFEMHAVKRWYQAGEGGTRFPFREEGVRALVPELLLKDDTLVRVDHDMRENYVKLRREEGDEYLWISFPRPDDARRDPYGRANLTDEPIHDAKELQPVTIPADTAKQFWLTARVPNYAPAGVYRGEIEVLAGEKVVETLDLELEVLPFDLEDNPLESSVYFHWGIDLIDEPGSLEFYRRSPSQYRAELRNLLDHGVDNPTMGVRHESGKLPVALLLRRQVRMANDNLYYLTARADSDSETVREIIDLAREFGFEHVYFYGRDEAKGDALRAQREDFERIHRLGGRVFAAGYHAESFPIVGDLKDLLVSWGDPSPEIAADWHSQGGKVFSYANPQSGLEEPETYRRNYGLLLAVNNYDGGMTYCYYHGWNDFSGERYRQHNFVYPTMDGVIDTVQWEGYREGIDDLRYLATLRRAIEKAHEAGGGRARLADRAQRFIDEMDVAGDLNELRNTMIDWILRLRE